MRIQWQAPRPTYRRVLRVKDLAQLGIESEVDFVFEKANRFTLEASDRACETLVSKLPGEFVLLEPLVPAFEPKAEMGTPIDDSNDSSSADDPQELPDAPQDREDDAPVVTPKVKRPKQ